MMDQGVPGSQNEPFFELLHPKAPPAPGVSSPPTSSVDAASEDSPPQDPSPLHDIPPSYDFQLTHSSKSSDPAISGDVGARVDDPPPFLYRGSSLPSSSDNHHHSFQGSANDTVRAPDCAQPPEVVDECNQLTMAAIDHTIKSCMDNLLHVLQNVSERVSQLENTVHGLENTIAGLKSAEGKKQDQSNERLLKLERLIAEIHTGVQLLHDKQKLDEARFHVSKLHLAEQNSAIGGVPQNSTEVWQQPRVPKEGVPCVPFSELPPQLPQHQPPQYPPPQAQSHFSHGPPPLPPEMQPVTPLQNMLPMPPGVNGPSNTPASQQSYSPQHLPAQPSVQQGPPPPPPQHSMQAASFHFQPPPQSLPQSSYHLPMETAAYGHMPPQQYNPPPPTPPSSTYLPDPPLYTGGTHGGPRQQSLPPQEMHPPPQQHNPVGSQHVYDGRMGPPATSMALSYPQPPPPKPAHAVPLYEASSGSGYGNPPYRAAQPVPSAPSGGGGGYPRLPTAQPLQHSVPAATRVSSGPSVRSPLEEVIEKVAGMGFSREQVSRVVQKLRENGQSVDMNVVLDKLMNGGDSSQPSRGWFGRG